MSHVPLPSEWLQNSWYSGMASMRGPPQLPRWQPRQERGGDGKGADQVVAMNSGSFVQFSREEGGGRRGEGGWKWAGEETKEEGTRRTSVDGSGAHLDARIDAARLDVDDVDPAIAIVGEHEPALVIHTGGLLHVDNVGPAPEVRLLGGVELKPMVEGAVGRVDKVDAWRDPVGHIAVAKA